MTRHAAIAVVLVNAIVLLAHDAAHRGLGILLSSWQEVFVYTVIVPSPILALLLIRRHARTGYALLLLSMLGSFLFGVYFHFVAISPDHVSHLPPGDSQQVFRATAVLMAVVQAGGALVGALGLAGLGSRRPVSPR